MEEAKGEFLAQIVEEAKSEDESEGNTAEDTWDEVETVRPIPSKIERNVCGAQSRNLFSIAKRDPNKRFIFDCH